MKLRLIMLTLMTFGLFAVGCADTEDCSAEQNCKRNAKGEPQCMAGFQWEDPMDVDNLNCVANDKTHSQGNPNPGNPEQPAPDPGNNDGCPPNSHLQGDSCYCDEGFVLNADQTGCVEGEPGDDANCPPNSHFENDGCYCDEGYSVNADGTACVAECESDTDCSNGQICENNSCREPRCTEGSCGEGMVCDIDSGFCIQDIGSLPPQPNLASNVLPAENSAPEDFSCIPDWQCNGSDCNDLVAFDPREGNHYWDYEINGEGSSQYRSFIRGDVRNLIRYSSAWVRCMTDGQWSFGNSAALALGDMSEANGDIPGTREGSPGHPPGTHVDGADMDIGYYQTQYNDTRLRSLCDPHTGGQDQYHCVSPPTNLDVWRTALVLAKMHDNPNLRVIGVDGQAGLLIESAIAQMCNAGWISGGACTNAKITWEVTDGGAGWYRFHHHHFHISVSRSNSFGLTMANQGCLSPTCSYDFREDPRHLLYPMLRTRLH